MTAPSGNYWVEVYEANKGYYFNSKGIKGPGESYVGAVYDTDKKKISLDSGDTHYKENVIWKSSLDYVQCW